MTPLPTAHVEARPRRSWAWTGLLVSSSTAGLLCLLGALGGPVLLLGVAVCVATALLLLRPEVRAHVNR